VRWEIDGANAVGCERALVSRKLGIQKLLTSGTTVIEFTPTEAGNIPFSCSMGMYRGSFTVLAS
jgi:plastocyanin domain-containing protein